jgi:hypothetical protein
MPLPIWDGALNCSCCCCSSCCTGNAGFGPRQNRSFSRSIFPFHLHHGCRLCLSVWAVFVGLQFICTSFLNVLSNKERLLQRASVALSVAAVPVIQPHTYLPTSCICSSYRKFFRRLRSQRWGLTALTRPSPITISTSRSVSRASILLVPQHPSHQSWFPLGLRLPVHSSLQLH